MGGKTQQRVAGNAKPANSGRIRELLANQQIGAGSPNKIITFSALSNRKQPQSSSKEPVPQDTTSVREGDFDEKKITKIAASSDMIVKQEPSLELETKQSSAVREIYRLVVKRVGNRDLYTRIKITDQDEQNLESAVPLCEAGVKKPEYLLGDITRSATNENTIEDPTSESKDEDDGDDNNEVDDSDRESITELEGEFDELLERLSRIQEVNAPVKDIESIDRLNETQISNEEELLQLLNTLVRRFSHDLSIEDWDLITQSLYRWIDWISRGEHPFREAIHSSFSVKVFKFICHLMCFAENLRNQDANHLAQFPMMQSILDDWSNFHSSNMFQDLLNLFFKLISLENSTSSQPTRTDQTVRLLIEALAHIITRVDPKLVLSHYGILDYLSPNVEFDPEWKEPKKSIYCHVDPRSFKSFLAVCNLLRSNCRVILVSAHAMLSKTLNAICENAIQVIILPSVQDQDEGIVDEDIPIFPPAALMSILTSRDAIMSALLSDYRVGDTSVTIEHNTDAYACTLSYLFVWDLVIQFIVRVDKEIGHKIIHSLKKLGLIQRLLDNIFMLLPPLGQQNSLRFRIYKSTSGKRQSTSLVATAIDSDTDTWNLEKFLKMPLQTTVKRPLNEVELIALHLYFSVASHMPVTVRKWYNNNSNKRLCNLVNEYTVKHVSRVICSLEMESVQEKCLERAQNTDKSVAPDNLTIKARPNAKEVYAVYSRDEFKMELTIKLPLNYPLGSVQIDGGKRVGVTDVKWRSWLLQLTTFLSHQNGPILDGIDLWRKNIDKRFEGIEKCTICFSILHSNYQLPKKKCQTCSNVFHNLCLFKWFESSGNSTCPLCRNPW